MNELVGFGDAHPMRRDRILKKRGRAITGLVTSIALLVSIVIAGTAISIGIARAGSLTAIASADHDPLAIAVFLALVFAGMGGVTAAFALRRSPSGD